ncbi:MAG: efflux RND transporter periplasmic adaptor subunit [Candidatus Marinimicrobia bacterium]|nr:efflux RND transporter periplasmic adaptor subunit [Candidatus Neomarinimicrobiota bacterium]
MKKKNRKKIVILIVVFIIIGIFIVFNSIKDKEKPIPVQTDKVIRDRIVQTVNASGSLIPITQVKISANVSARIINIAIKEGDTVKQGDLLVELDRTQYEAAYERALSVVGSNKANRKKVKSDLKRIKALYDNDLTSEAELEAAIAQNELAMSQVVQSEAMLKQALDDLNKTRIEAPMDGIVTSLRKEIGEIALGSVFQEDVILVISDMSKMKVKVEVDETDVVNVNIGDTSNIEIDAIPDTVFKGVVSEIAHSATTRGLGTQEQVTNFEVEISVIGQDFRFRPGMSSTVDIITELRDSAIVVPIQSLTVRKPEILEGEDKSGEGEKPEVRRSTEKKVTLEKGKSEEVVFIVKHPISEDNPKKTFLKKKADPRAEQRAVKIGISSDTHFEIIKGLEEGEEIVVGSYKAISKELEDDSSLKITKKSKEKGKRK